MTQFGYLSLLLLSALLNIVESYCLHALDSKQIKNYIWLSRTLVNVMEEYFANKIIQLCGKQHETEVTKLGKCAELNLN